MKEVASTLSRFDFWKIIHFANYSFLYSELLPLCRNVIPAMGKPAKEQKQLAGEDSPTFHMMAEDLFLIK